MYLRKYHASSFNRSSKPKRQNINCSSALLTAIVHRTGKTIASTPGFTSSPAKAILWGVRPLFTTLGFNWFFTLFFREGYWFGGVEFISCCRFGVLDSLGLGMRLEKMLVGHELPAKAKIGVSGRPNNCGEAYVRDIGVFARKSGWTFVFGDNSEVDPAGLKNFSTKVHFVIDIIS